MGKIFRVRELEFIVGLVVCVVRGVCLRVEEVMMDYELFVGRCKVYFVDKNDYLRKLLYFFFLCRYYVGWF